jgi:hypothetical protein
MAPGLASLSPAVASARRGSGWRARLLAAAERPREVFLIFVLVYLTTYGGHYTSGDGFFKRAWAEAIVWRHSANIAPGQPPQYSMYPIGPTLLSIPPLVLGRLATASFGLHLSPVLYTILFVVNGAAFMALVCEYLRRCYPAPTVLRTLALLGLASIWWPYTKLDFFEAIVTTLFLAGVVLAKRGRTFPAFFLAGFAATLREDALILLAALGLWELLRTREWRRVPWMAAGVLPWVVLNCIANYSRWNSLVNRGYPQGFFGPELVGLYGYLFSAGKSVFLFSPPLLLGFLGWRRFASRVEYRADARLFLGVFAVQLLVFSKWMDWSGDDAWGPRYLLTCTMLMAIPAVELVDQAQAYLPTLAFGIGVQLLAILPGPLSYILLLHGRHAERLPLYVGLDSRQRVDIDDMRFNPRFSQLAGHFMLVERMLGIEGSTDVHGEADAGTPLSVALPVSPDQVQADILWFRALRGSVWRSTSP